MARVCQITNTSGGILPLIASQSLSLLSAASDPLSFIKPVELCQDEQKLGRQEIDMTTSRTDHCEACDYSSRDLIALFGVKNAFPSVTISQKDLTASRQGSEPLLQNMMLRCFATVR